jgi:predicted PolB exonuclease-like 3'-5' exonuclease
MAMDKAKVAYLVFDVETAADADLVAKIRFPDDDLDPMDAVTRYRNELLEATGSDFIPYTYQFPVSVVIAKVRQDFRIHDVVAIDEPEFRPHVITEKFWRGWKSYGKPTFVTFNGRSFDMPLMELAAHRYGISVPDWFSESLRSWEKPRNRYNTSSHLDLQDLLTNYGASRFSGGLNLAANLLAKPGKMDVQGDMVQDMYDSGDLAAINDYCRCDVLDTYFVFLRTRVTAGQLALDEEEAIVAETKQWLLERADDSAAYQAYLNRWSDWVNPWALDSDTAATDGQGETNSSSDGRSAAKQSP